MTSTLRLKHLAEIKASNVDKKSVEGDTVVRLCNYMDVYRHDLITEGINFMSATATTEQIANLSLKAGDVLITKDSERADDIGIPAFVPLPIDNVVCGYHLSILRPDPDGINPKFLFWALKSEGVRAHFTKHANGVTRFALGYGDIGMTEIPVPRIEDQAAIVRYLDETTAQIDSLIKRKLNLIALQEALFDSLADRMIKPLDRPLERLRHVSGGVTVGVVVNPSTYVDPGGSVPFFRGIDVKRYSIDVVGAQRITEESNRILFKSKLDAEDIVTVRDGDPGTSAVVPHEADGSNCASLLITRRGERVDSRYLCQVFNSRYGRSQFGALAYGAAQKHVNVSHAVDFRVPLPDIEEQQAIANQLDYAWKRLNTLRKRIEAQVTLLHEYRSALITAAVTGQIVVSEVA